MNTDNFIITSSDIELAQDICKIISEDGIRSRAVANAVAAGIAIKYFDKDTYEVDTDSGLHNIGVVLEDIDISDIYINNNYIDVRVFFNESELGVPVSHFEHNLIPAAYMFIKITSDLSGATVVGFKNPESIDKNNTTDGYYKLSEDALESFYDIEPLLSAKSGDDTTHIDDSEIYDYLDNNIKDKYSFYSKLLESREARIKLAKAAKAKNIFKFVSINSDKKTNDTDNSAAHKALEEQELKLAADISFVSDNFTDDETGNSAENLELSDNESIQELVILDNDINTASDEADAVQQVDSPALTADDNESQNSVNAEDLELELGLAALSASDSDEQTDVNTENTEEETNSETPVNDENFEYSTVAVPSSAGDDLLDELSKEETVSASENSSENTNTSEQQIDALFNNNEEDLTGEDDLNSPGMKVYSKKQAKPGVSVRNHIVFALLIFAAAFGYAGYVIHSASGNNPVSSNVMPVPTPPKQEESIPAAPAEEAMPIETVETVETPQVSNNEGNSTSIPAIEQNLDASILVSNLKVDWEVPAGYASNTSAKRYLVKLGKIIQLNLKTELLLLSKPPITNKIAVEITYNNGSRKFEAVGITISSGEKTVDDLIMQTVNKALAMNLSTNTDSFAKLQGNPVLIIHL